MRARVCTLLVSCLAAVLVTMAGAKVASADDQYPGGCFNDITGNIGACISETYDAYLHGVGYINVSQPNCYYRLSVFHRLVSHGGQTLATTDWQWCGDATQPELVVSPDVYLNCSSGCGPGELYFSSFEVTGDWYTTLAYSPDIRP